jgi:hypothetical protein
MSKGPRGAKRPADVIGNAVKVMRIAIALIDERDKGAGYGRIGHRLSEHVRFPARCQFR